MTGVVPQVEKEHCNRTISELQCCVDPTQVISIKQTPSPHFEEHRRDVLEPV